jgi:hypothetical protein
VEEGRGKSGWVEEGVCIEWMSGSGIDRDAVGSVQADCGCEL